MIRPTLLGLGGLWMLLSLCTCIPAPIETSEEEMFIAQKAAHISPVTSSQLHSLPSFWQTFQEAAGTGSPAALVGLIRFPLFQYGDHLLLQDWISKAPVEWLGKAAPLQQIEEEQLVPVDLTPYGIQGLDQAQGFAAEVPLLETGGTCVLLFGKVEGKFAWVGKIP